MRRQHFGHDFFSYLKPKMKPAAWSRVGCWHPGGGADAGVELEMSPLRRFAVGKVAAMVAAVSV
jgi:hypothetical protein